MNSNSPNTADIVERLLAVESSTECMSDSVTTCWHRNPDGPEAAAEITELREALEEARRAIDTLDEDAFGLVFDQHTGSPAYPVRDELLAKLAAALKDHRKAQT